MNQYVRAKCVVEKSETSDFAKCQLHEMDESATITEGFFSCYLEAVDSGVDFGPVSQMFETMTNFIVENTDSTNDITMTITMITAAATIDIEIPAGQWIKLTDVDFSDPVTFTSPAGTTPTLKLTAW